MTEMLKWTYKPPIQVKESILTDLTREVDSPSEDFPSTLRKHLATSENFFLNTGVGTLKQSISEYCNDPVLAQKPLANSVDPDLIWVYTVCQSVSIYHIERPLCLNLNIITSVFAGVRIFQIFNILLSLYFGRVFVFF